MSTILANSAKFSQPLTKFKQVLSKFEQVLAGTFAAIGGAV